MLTVVPRPIVVRAPSKVNLHLSVGDLRDDGFHELETVYQALSLHDDVSVVTSNVTSLVVRGDDASSVPTDASNLAWRAAAMVAESVKREPNVAITIDKGIPVAGGMAGGSADAAAALLAVDALWNLELSRAELMSFAERLGSDVPFALAGGTSVGTGRGEKLLPVLSRNTFHWVLALAKGGLSTPAVYRELDELRAKGSPPRLGDSKDLMLALASGDPQRVAPLLGNDLQAAALSLSPKLRRTLRAGVAAGALAGIVSGSGPTCAFLCTTAESAVAVSAELAGAGVCRTVRVATGPVPGARVLSDGNFGDHNPGQQQRGHH